MKTIRACHCCGLVHTIPDLQPDETAECTRCGADFPRPGQSGVAASRTAAAAVAAFVLFWPAVLCPILVIEKLGIQHQSSVLGGIIDLLRHGSWFVGGIVLVFSIVFPLTKIILLLELSLLEVFHKNHKALSLRIMEHAGKWSMMDVMLLAFLVMLVKLGNLVQFQFGPAVIAFVLCVAMSMLASVLFDPHAIWEDDVEQNP
ncbi:MAG: paraquat-inducible protein A [Planctomyces sp.]|nr:paraquat-inducible protein A [Planctomyces sp.]